MNNIGEFKHGKEMVKEHSLLLIETNMYGNSRMVTFGMEWLMK